MRFIKTSITAVALALGLAMSACGGTGAEGALEAQTEQALSANLATDVTVVGQLSGDDCPVGQMICEGGPDHCSTDTCISVRSCLSCIASSYSAAGYSGVTLMIEPY